MLATNLLFFVIACLAMVLSGTWLVKSLTKIARFLRITEFAAAFIIMAIATSLPELFVGISSALAKNPALALGNILGANILDLTLIMGIIILLGRGIKVGSRKIKKDTFYMIFILMLPIILFAIGKSLSRIDGIILVGVFSLYSWRMLKRRRKFEKELKDQVKRLNVVLNVFLFVACLFVLFFSAKFVIRYASALAIDLVLPPIMIGLFIISVGTTLPELTFGTRAVLMGHGEMALGDQIGTIVANSTLILGVTAIIYPISAHFSLFLISAVFMIFAAFLFATFMGSSSKLGVREGTALILLYIFFIIVEFYVKGVLV